MIDAGKDRAAKLVAEVGNATAEKDWRAWAREAFPLLKEIAEAKRPEVQRFRGGTITLDKGDTLESFDIATGEKTPPWTVASTTLVIGGIVLADGRTALVVRPL